MLVVIEGSDKTGKTTLAKKIGTLLKCPIMHFSKPPENAKDYFSYAVYGGTNYPLVVDRWISGDSIYAEAMGHEKRLSDWDYNILLTVAAMQGIIFVFCWDDDEAVAKRFVPDKEDFTPVEKIEKIQTLFQKEAERLAQDGRFPVLRINNFTNELKVLSYGNTTHPWTEFPLPLPEAVVRNVDTWRKDGST